MKKTALILICILTFTFTVNASVFTDVDSNHWAQKEIEFFSKNGVINGYSDGSFLPNNKVTREEFCKMLSTVLNVSPATENIVNFSDVSNERWSHTYIQRCHKFMGMYSNSDYFYPGAYATRGDVAVALVSAIGYSTGDEDIYTAQYFIDSGDIPFEIMDAVGAASKLGLISGYPDGSFKAVNGITRAEVLVVLKRAIDFVESQEANKLKTTDQFSNNKIMRNAYSDFLDKNCVFSGTDMYTCEYFIYDMDKDGCEELIVKLGTCEADMKLIVCSYIDGKVVKLGETDGGHCSIHGNKNGVGLTVYYGHQGIQWIDSLNISNGQLETEQLMAMQEVAKYTYYDYTFPLNYYDKQDKSIFNNTDRLQTQNQYASKTKKITFIQDSLYDVVSNEKYIPQITLYTDGTFEFMCNYYSYMETLRGKFECITDGDYIERYSFIVESEIPEGRASRPTFTIVYNTLTNEVIFNTNYANAFGMTGTYINKMFSAR